MVAADHRGVHRQSLKPCPLQELWPGLVERHGGHLTPEFDLSTLASLSEGYASGTIEQARATHHPSELLSTLCSISGAEAGIESEIQTVREKGRGRAERELARPVRAGRAHRWCGAG